MWVKRARKETLQEAFAESIQVEKDMFFLNENPTTLAEKASTSYGKIKNFPKTTATKYDPFNMFDMKKLLQKMSNEMVDLKKNSNESQNNNRGFEMPPFKRPNKPPQNPPPPNPSEGFTLEKIFSVLKSLVLGTHDASESSNDRTNQDSELPQEEEEQDQQVNAVSFFSEEEEEEPNTLFNL